MRRHDSITKSVGLMVWCLVGLTGSTAWAQQGAEPAEATESTEEGPTELDAEIAKKTAEEASRAYENGEHAKAINLFLTAYEHVQAPIFLSSAASVARDAGTPARAKRLAERALAPSDFPLTEIQRKKVEQMIVELDAEIAAKMAQTGEWSWVGYTGGGLVVLGASSMVGTLVLAAGVDARRDELASSTTKPEYDALYDELSGQQQLAQGLLYTGAGLALAGGALIAWDLLTPGGVPYETPQVALELGPEKTSIQVGWRW